MELSLSSSSSSSLPPTWESCKENVLPIKRGRSAKGLSEVLKDPINDNGSSSSNDAKDINRLREQVFEDTIKNSTSTKQLLDTYISYYKWIRDRYRRFRYSPPSLLLLLLLILLLQLLLLLILLLLLLLLLLPILILTTTVTHLNQRKRWSY